MEVAPAFLRGEASFPGIEGWRADAALCARQNLKGREYVDPDCGPLLQRLDALAPNDWTATLLSPEVFAFLVNDDDEWTWALLARRLDERPGRGGGAGRLPVLWEEPAAEFTAALRRHGIGSRGPSSSDASFLPPSDPEFPTYRSRISAAAGLVLRLCPGYMADICEAVDRVALVDERASFRGSSGIGFRGLVMLAPEPDWSPGIFAEEMVHEGTHCLLDLISVREPLVAGEDAMLPQWSAPFRPDKRPLYGNFHAVVVVSRLIHLFRRMAEEQIEPERDWLARANEYAQRSEEAVHALVGYPHLSEMARRLMDSLVVPTLQTELRRSIA